MDVFEVQDVPHGEVNTVYYYSKVEEAWRPLMVYTPAGYNEGKQEYPVVYIQHGGGQRGCGDAGNVGYDYGQPDCCRQGSTYDRG